MHAALSKASRRNFLRGRAGAPAPLRPPWAQEEDAFIALCTRCDRCADACETDIIRRGSGGYPEVDFAAGGCTLCRACLEACDNGALQPSQPAWRLRAVAAVSCLSYRGIVCRSCGDRCDRNAIRFRLQAGGRAIPQVDQTLCNGCGQCISACPEGSLSMQPVGEDIS